VLDLGFWGPFDPLFWTAVTWLMSIGVIR